MTGLLVPQHVARTRRGEQGPLAPGAYPDRITVVGKQGILPVELPNNHPLTAYDAYLRAARGARTFHIKNNPLAAKEGP